jgi:endonuclease/exonuclease/phosphatase family metal-dependent hydrolase
MALKYNLAGGGLWAASLFFSMAGTGSAQEPVAAAPPELPEVPVVRFTAWNVKNYLFTTQPPPDGSADRPKPAGEQQLVTAILLKLRPDILGVCEMGSPADLAHLQAALKSGGLDLPHSEHVQGDDPTRHVALLSRFPITSRQPVTQPRYLLDQSEFPIQRGFLDVTVAVTPDYALRLVGVHLKSRRDVREADQALMRRNEAHLLRQHVDGILTAIPQTNLLVYGDFNDTRDQPGLHALKSPGSAAQLVEITAQDDSGERWTYYYPEADEYSRIDFLLASAALLPEMKESEAFLYSGADWIKASDHRPVTALLHADDHAGRRKPKQPKPASSP